MGLGVLPEPLPVAATDTLTAVKLSAILPLPVAVAQQPTSVFIAFDGEPVLARIVRALAATGDVLVAADERLVGRARSDLGGLPVRVVAAGESPGTADCLAVAARHLQSESVTHALVADHRHPVLPAGLVQRVVAALSGGADLVVPVLPVTDTVKSVDAQGTILTTVDRSELRITQYPYGAALPRLADLHAVLGEPDLVTVAGDADAIPLDLPGDAALLAAIIACRR